MNRYPKPLAALVIAAAISLGLSSASRQAAAQRDPLAGRDRFPEFRNLSGLAGGGFGSDSQGYPSLSGPVALSTPVAHVPGHDHLYVSIERTSVVNRPEFVDKFTNGTACVTFGHTFGNVNVAGTDMILTALGKQVFNVQAQIIPSVDSRWAASVGVQDFLTGSGGASGNGVPGDTRASRSFFGVLTYHVPANLPLFVSLGGGSRRFSQGFASLSCQVLKPLRVYVEHDGFGMNTGVVATVRTGKGKTAAELGVRLGVVQQRWFTLGGTLGF